MKEVKSKKPQMFLLLGDLEILHATHLHVFLYPLNRKTRTQTSSVTKLYHTKHLKAVDQGRRIKHKHTRFDLYVGTS